MPVKKNLFMFSGQGSQYYQMGQTLYVENRIFRDHMDRMDLIVRDLAGCSVVNALYNDGHSKAETFDRMLLTHPATFMVQYALAQILIGADIIPDMTLGTSLGAFAAAVVAGMFTAEDALKSIIRQAQTFELHCPRGGMIAILADPKLYQEDVIRNNSEIASYNFSSHFVIAAPYGRLSKIEACLREKRLAFQRLPVSFAYHSRWIEEMKPYFQECERSLQFKSGMLAMVCCAESAIFDSLSADYFWGVARKPILFQQTVAKLENDGTYQYIDMGPSGTLATFLKYILSPNSESTALQTLTPFGCDLNTLTAHLRPRAMSVNC